MQQSDDGPAAVQDGKNKTDSNCVTARVRRPLAGEGRHGDDAADGTVATNRAGAHPQRRNADRSHEDVDTMTDTQYAAVGTHSDTVDTG